MTISRTKKLGGVAAAAGIALALAGCGAAPETEEGTAAPEAESDFLPCLISDEGGWNDRSFNQSAKEGMDRALESRVAALRSGQAAVEAQLAQQGREGVAVATSVLALQRQMASLQEATAAAVGSLQHGGPPRRQAGSPAAPAMGAMARATA